MLPVPKSVQWTRLQSLLQGWWEHICHMRHGGSICEAWQAKIFAFRGNYPPADKRAKGTSALEKERRRLTGIHRQS